MCDTIDSIVFPLTAKQLCGYLAEDKSDPDKSVIVLPNIQRDVVWKSKQICELWDSIFSGIPIPAIILTRINDISKDIHRCVDNKYSRYDKNIKNTRRVTDKDYFLIDGQQRCMSIKLGLGYSEDIKIWIDLGWKRKRESLHWGFYLCSKARPWGEREDFSKADSRLIRDARERLHNSGIFKIDGDFDFQIPLNHTWPVHAKAPVPLFDILKEDKMIDIAFLNNIANKLQIPDEIKKDISKCISNIDCEFLKNLQKSIDRTNGKILHGIICELNDADDLLLAFKRINQNGTDLKPSELFYSGIKNKLHEVISIDGTIINLPENHYISNLETLRGITVLASHECDGLDRTTLDFDMLKSLMSDKHIEGFTSRFKGFVDFKLEKSFAILKDIFLLKNAGKEIDYGLPFVMLPRIKSKTWIPVLAWIECNIDNINFNNIVDESRKNIIRFILIDHIFGSWSNEDKLLREFMNLVRSVELFPTIDCFKKCEDDKLLWLKRVNIDGDNRSTLCLPLTPDEFFEYLQSNLRTKKTPLDVDGVLWASGRWIDILLWNQRHAVDKWFDGYEKDVIILGEEGKPWDHDHIVPNNFFNYSKFKEPPVIDNLSKYCGDDEDDIWNKFRHYRYHTGNYRIWPLGFNRSDKDICAKEKLNPTYKLAEWIVLSDWWNSNIGTDAIKSASSIENNDKWDLTAENKDDWDSIKQIAFLESVTERENKLYNNIFNFFHL